MYNITAVIPAFNEAKRIRDVLQAILDSSLVNELIVVDDGSTDQTAEIAGSLEGVRVIRLAENCGKGTAMRTGAIAARGEIVLFLDGDLRGLKSSQVDDLVGPIAHGRAEMAIGIFHGGRASTDLAQIISPNISGQRCLYRDFFLSAPLIEGSRSGVEIALTIHARANKLPIEIVPLEGATHVMKEEKLGFWSGSVARFRMYMDILMTLARYRLLTRQLRHTPVGSD